VTEVNVTTDGSTVVNRATDVIITANSDVLAVAACLNQLAKDDVNVDEKGTGKDP